MFKDCGPLKGDVFIHYAKSVWEKKRVREGTQGCNLEICCTNSGHSTKPTHFHGESDGGSRGEPRMGAGWKDGAYREGLIRFNYTYWHHDSLRVLPRQNLKNLTLPLMKNCRGWRSSGSAWRKERSHQAHLIKRKYPSNRIIHTSKTKAWHSVLRIPDESSERRHAGDQSRWKIRNDDGNEKSMDIDDDGNEESMDIDDDGVVLVIYSIL